MITPKQKIDLMRTYEASPGAAFLNGLELIRQELLAAVRDSAGASEERITALVAERIAAAESGLADKVVLQHVDRLKGDPGDPADPEEVARILAPQVVSKAAAVAEDTARAVIVQPADGATPRKFVDYFTPGEVAAMKEEILAAATPRKGKHYLTNADVEEMARAVIERMPPDADEGVTMDDVRKFVEESLPRREEITAEKIVGLINSLPAGAAIQIDASRIRNLPRAARGKYHAAHGGGDTVLAGSNVTITTNADGTKTISATGGGAIKTSATAADGSARVFAVDSRPAKVYADNSVFFENLAPGDGGGYTYSAGFITLFFPPQNYVKYE